jgi:Nucleotidyl transferase AbiEii toxin, Type IV TA system
MPPKKRQSSAVSDLDILSEIRRLAIASVFSVDELLNRLVLKGGNALDLVLGVGQRSSLDLDFSMADDFSDDELEALESRLLHFLGVTFIERGYRVFDLTIRKRPPTVSEDMVDFWGGYRLEFKIIDQGMHDQLHANLESMRRQAVEVGPNHKRKITVDISAHEYCEKKTRVTVEGLTAYVYSPAMIACEKLRAICQQMPEYGKIVKSHSQSARARDFFDIWIVCDRCDVNLTSAESKEIICAMFEAKRAPLRLLGRIQDFREYHRQDWVAVENTVHRGVKLRPFDWYFDFVVDQCRALEPLWVE